MEFSYVTSIIGDFVNFSSKELVISFVVEAVNHVIKNISHDR